jgi:uncharacterized membrane protein
VWRRIWRRLIETVRRDFIAGLLVFVPVGFTILGVLWIIDQLDQLVLPRIFSALGMQASQPRAIGALVTLCVILLAGALTRSFIGRAALLLWERIVSRIPVARSLYSVLKQFMETVFGSAGEGAQFNRVVLVEYPRKGIHSYAFVITKRGGSADAQDLRAEHAESDDRLLPAHPRSRCDRDRAYGRRGVPAHHLRRHRHPREPPCLAAGRGRVDFSVTERARKVVCKNRKARHRFHIQETIEAGMELRGPEVKSLREGRAALSDGYARIDRGQVFLANVHIAPYEPATRENPDPDRVRFVSEG